MTRTPLECIGGPKHGEIVWADDGMRTVEFPKEKPLPTVVDAEPVPCLPIDDCRYTYHRRLVGGRGAERGAIYEALVWDRL